MGYEGCKIRYNMTYPNRVNPFGELFVPQSSAVRGSLTGNRGRLHNSQAQIVRPFENKRWIYCRLDYPKPSHPVMAPGRWTHLFFLDEATALAAGHRPCSLCLHERFKAFQGAMARWAFKYPNGQKPTAEMIDALLHSERITSLKEKKTYLEQIENLPDGCFLVLEDDAAPYLLLGDELLKWTPNGYSQRVPRPKAVAVTVITPWPTVKALSGGFRVEVR